MWEHPSEHRWVHPLEHLLAQEQVTAALSHQVEDLLC
jgi:hypothetical protein